MAGELIGSGLELSTEELGGAPAVKDVGDRDEERAGGVMEERGECGY